MSAPELTAYADGVGQISADQLNTFCQTCDNLEQLQSFIGTIGQQVYLRGYVDIGDGGQGSWWWNPDAIGPSDNVNVVIPDGAASGGWTRLDYASFRAVFLPKNSDPPEASVTGGFLYVDSTGALQYRGPTSTTEIAPA